MDLKMIQQRAIAIRKKYALLEKEKTGKEWTNLNLMEGFVGDVGDLMKLVMAKEGIREIEDVDKKLSHELADCFWSILILADKYDIDLESSFVETMDDLEQRIDLK